MAGLPSHTEVEAMKRAISDFIIEDDDAHTWFHTTDANTDDCPDCDVMSERFVAFLARRGIESRVVHVRPPTPQPWYSDHWFVVAGVIAVDWTAKQFWNVHEDMSEWIDATLIPVPLCFAWPGDYPFPNVTFEEVPA